MSKKIWLFSWAAVLTLAALMVGLYIFMAYSLVKLIGRL